MIDDLGFSSPQRLWLLAAGVALGVAYAVSAVVRRRRAGRFASPPMLSRLTSGAAGRWRRVLPVLFLGSVVLAALGAAQPTVPAQVEREKATIVVAIDTSDSMNATDVRPTRLQAAIDAARGFVSDLPSTYDVGLVTAGAAPVVVAAPTLDHGKVLEALTTLETAPGTALGDAIFTALATLPRVEDRAAGAADGSDGEPGSARAARIVLLSDGVTTTGRPDVEAIAAAAEAGVPVSTIAFGTDEATVRSAGQTVDVAVDTTALEAIAEGTQGLFFEAATRAELASIYDRIDAEVTVVDGRRDVAEWFAGAAIALLLVAVVASMLGTSRAVWA
ncbi:MAG TPA: VWA domain-containing protein [Acidimicrobiales bacterium]|nr:VWA domain-containing protein [Acidimicrobiales bacterium]